MKYDGLCVHPSSSDHLIARLDAVDVRADAVGADHLHMLADVVETVMVVSCVASADPSAPVMREAICSMTRAKLPLNSTRARFRSSQAMSRSTRRRCRASRSSGSSTRLDLPHGRARPALPAAAAALLAVPPAPAGCESTRRAALQPAKSATARAANSAATHRRICADRRDEHVSQRARSAKAPFPRRGPRRHVVVTPRHG